MQIDERVVDGVTILDLKGKMTLGEGDELLKDKINSLIQQDRKKLLLNLEGVPYIDSAGLGEIVRTYTTVSRQGGKLKLLNLTKRIQDLLAITKLLTVFETYESEPDAIKSFVGSGVSGANAGTSPVPLATAALRMARHTAPDLIERIADRPAPRRPDQPLLLSLVRSLRPAQWIKNLIIFGALMLSGRLLDPTSILYAAAAFVIFCGLSGVVYLVNDIADREADRSHPIKMHRPIASGALPVRSRPVRPEFSARSAWGRRSCSGSSSACWPQSTWCCSGCTPGR